MKFFVASLVISFLSFTASAQKLRLAGLVSASGSMGFENPILGGTAGIDFEKGNFVISFEGEYARVHKTEGGKGYQVSGRQLVRKYALPGFFIQAGAVETHYSLTRYDKTSLQGLAGIGFEQGRMVVEVNYRHDFTSENRQRILESRFHIYLKHHIYLNPSCAVSSLVTAGRRTAGAQAKLGIGFYF